eukprot:CAMPEP_0175100396 /NCGR_PEP_ID=MMETSP0086_2-20121207/7082_1 /TAXON_ID=136419 /ORGANISM="Unknown Unknown, Strain D1" /LENGTH=335 /DNA_ID=CAMNT_0016374539 /DNA_START=139 /DNA_END=1148 /DNA_ORIENTATION=-
MLLRAELEPEKLAHELRTSPIAQLAPAGDKFGVSSSPPPAAPAAADAVPIVITHGMGDSCFNPGMKQITQAAGQYKGVYSVCVPGGDTQMADTISGFFDNMEMADTISGFLTNMDKNVDIFAAKVRNDTNLKGGFDAMGLSQGNSVIRGYIERYNNPPVRNYLSIHGTVMGVAGFPNCNPAGPISGICDVIAEALGDMAYADIIQNHLFQANYFRDPVRLTSSAYLSNSQIAQWNNENTQNALYTKNFESVKSYNMIKALKDTMVYPNEGEWWGQFTPGQFKTIEQMKDTALYKNNSFGLATVDSAHKIRTNTTAGEHLQFTIQDMEWWINEYFN